MPQNGFDVDVGGLSQGNTITVNYTDTATNTPHTITLVRVDDPAALPLANTATATANDTVFGIDFSGGMASVVAQINTAFTGTGMSASNPSGTTLEILDDGAGNTVDVNSVSATNDRDRPIGRKRRISVVYRWLDAIHWRNHRARFASHGLAARIAVNPSVVADPSRLVTYQPGTAAGDSTRPDFILQQLTGASLTFSPNTGIGTASAPFIGTLTTYLRQVISQQGEAASSADNLKQGQDVVLNALQQRFNDTSGVNVDQEMANLLTLQNSYAANARVMSVVKDMLDALIQM